MVFSGGAFTRTFKVKLERSSFALLRMTIRKLLPLGTFGENHLDVHVRARDDMYGHELADTLSRRRTGIGCRFDRADIAAHHHGDIAAADHFLTDERHLGRLYHRIGSFDGTNEALRFDHAERIKRDI